MATNIIKITRGDSFSFEFDYPLLKANEVIYFALLYPNQAFEDAIIIKGYTLEDQNVADGSFAIKLSPRETRSLAPGVYYYTIKYQRGGSIDTVGDFDDPDEVKTLIERTKFIVCE